MDLESSRHDSAIATYKRDRSCASSKPRLAAIRRWINNRCVISSAEFELRAPFPRGELMAQANIFGRHPHRPRALLDSRARARHSIRGNFRWRFAERVSLRLSVACIPSAAVEHLEEYALSWSNGSFFCLEFFFLGTLRSMFPTITITMFFLPLYLSRSR